LIYIKIGSRDIEGLWTGRPEFGSQKSKIFLFSKASKSGVCPASYAMETREYFPENKDDGA
jgi:hypothetical protein